MTPTSAQIVREKLSQAVSLLERYDFDLWLTFVRETSLTKDPALDLVCPYGLTWHSAFLVHRGGERIAIVGRYDVENIESLDAYSRVVGYDESIRSALTDALRRLGPKRIALNISRSDPAADGLTVGMRRFLDEILAEAGVQPDQCASAEALLASLRGKKSPGEAALIRQAISTTEQLFEEVGQTILPGVTEKELAGFLHDRVRELGLDAAWDSNFNPLVNTGPDSAIGHAAPGDLAVEPGHLVHFDFGIRQEGFCSDLQRMWYVLSPGEPAPPEPIQATWDAVRSALLAGAEALRPGARGWEVDAAARQSLLDSGLPEFKHAFGHNVGRMAHDGGTVLGPRWERYGDTPSGVVEADNVFAIELGAKVEDRGWIYLEENVLVTSQGVEWLSTPQETLWLVRP